MIDPEIFGQEIGKVVKEIIDKLKAQIEELQKRVAELENLTEGLK
ncbi:MAG: hypothetical protein RBR82_14660 [Pseudomonas sp.]|nr:hypothetical protein [Pseudomonas sp.]